jgi:hypothetical protein
MSWLRMLIPIRVTGGWQCYIVALLLTFLWNFCVCLHCVVHDGYWIYSFGWCHSDYCHKIQKPVCFFELVGHWKPVAVGVSGNTQLLLWSMNGNVKANIEVACELFFSVSCCAVEVFKVQWRVSFVCALNATLTGLDDSIWSHSAIFCKQFRNRWTSLFL